MVDPMSYNAHTPFEIDFIDDCGADPSGVANCAPALTKAVALALALATSPAYRIKVDVTLHVPPGVYKFTSGIGNADLVGISSFRIRGHRAASIFVVSGGLGGTAIASFANCLFIEIDGLTIVGDGVLATDVDAGALFALNPQYDCHISNMLIQNCVVLFYGIRTAKPTMFSHVTVLDCACQDATEGFLYGFGARSLIFDMVSFVDGGSLNGTSFPNRIGTMETEIRVDGPCDSVLFRNCFLDEGCKRNVFVDGTSGPIGIVESDGLRTNIPTLAGGIAGFHVKDADRVIIRKIWQGINRAIPLVKLENVTRADIENPETTVAPAAALVIDTDVACGFLRVVDPKNFNESKIDISSALSVLEEKGITADLYAAAAAVPTAGQLVKMAAAGTVTPLVAGDAGNVAIVRGPALRAAGLGAPVAVVRTSQPVTMISDGAGPIAVNARVTPSGVAAGRVVANGVATDAQLGIALTAAAAVADAPVTVMWVPGNMGVL
jgi:hypothetical protein